MKHSRRTRAAALTATVAVLHGCGAPREDFGLTEMTPTLMPSELSCPTGSIVATDGGLLATMPDGDDTREEALAGFIPRFPHWGKRYAIDDDGSAWFLRADGTARARVTFVEHKGYTAHGYEECTE